MDGEEEVLVKLNNLWIDSYKLQAFQPLYERKEAQGKSSRREVQAAEAVESKAAEKVYKEQAIEAPRAQAMVGVKEGKSFLQGAKGCTCSCSVKQTQLWTTTFVPEVKESRWLENARVGKLKSAFSWEENGEDMQEEANGKFEVKSLGDNLILINPVSDDIEGLGRLEEWGFYWCSWVRMWKPTDVSKQREVWTYWYGVPMHAWSERFFKQVSLRFGAYVEWDSITEKKLALDRARVKIRGFPQKAINEIVVVCIDRSEFPVIIVEEAPGKVGCMPKGGMW